MDLPLATTANFEDPTVLSNLPADVRIVQAAVVLHKAFIPMNSSEADASEEVTRESRKHEQLRPSTFVVLQVGTTGFKFQDNWTTPEGVKSNHPPSSSHGFDHLYRMALRIPLRQSIL